MRDPLDVLVSFYHHLVNMAVEDGGYRGPPEQFAQDFLDGRILYGKWQDHLEAWLGQQDEGIASNASASSSSSSSPPSGSLLLHYQDMKNDLPFEASRVARFLGVSEHRLHEVLAEALPLCTFDSMKAEGWRYTPQSVSWNTDPVTGRPYDQFVRRGQVGDGTEFEQNMFTPELKAQWKKDLESAERRWQKAGVDATIVERYLKSRSTGNDMYGVAYT
jgi:hypothetical protein